MHIGCFCFFDKFRTIDNRVAVIDAVSTEKFHGSFNVANVLRTRRRGS